MNTTRIEAFRMHLKPGNEAEYARRHAQLWPEMKKLLQDAGVSDYNIFLDRATGNLFAVQRVSGARAGPRTWATTRSAASGGTSWPT